MTDLAHANVWKIGDITCDDSSRVSPEGAENNRDFEAEVRFSRPDTPRWPSNRVVFKPRIFYKQPVKAGLH